MSPRDSGKKESPFSRSTSRPNAIEPSALIMAMRKATSSMKLPAASRTDKGQESQAAHSSSKSASVKLSPRAQPTLSVKSSAHSKRSSQAIKASSSRKLIEDSKNMSAAKTNSGLKSKSLELSSGNHTHTHDVSSGRLSPANKQGAAVCEALPSAKSGIISNSHKRNSLVVRATPSSYSRTRRTTATGLGSSAKEQSAVVKPVTSEKRGIASKSRKQSCVSIRERQSSSKQRIMPSQRNIPTDQRRRGNPVVAPAVIVTPRSVFVRPCMPCECCKCNIPDVFVEEVQSKSCCICVCSSRQNW